MLNIPHTQGWRKARSQEQGVWDTKYAQLANETTMADFQAVPVEVLAEQDKPLEL